MYITLFSDILVDNVNCCLNLITDITYLHWYLSVKNWHL